MKSLNKIWNTIKDFNLIKYEIINGTIESHKFELLMKFDGIIQKGKTMTINDLAKIVNNLAIEMREGFKRVDEKFSDMKEYMDTRFDVIEADIILIKEDVNVLKEDVKVLKEDVNVLKEDVKVLKEDVNVLKEEVAKHSDIFKRNNLK